MFHITIAKLFQHIMPSNALERLTDINSRIAGAAQRAGRQTDEIRLIGASKKQSAEWIRTFVTAGLNNIGENYLQEAINKQSALSDENIDWHFIGQIQSNKTRLIAQHFNWVHGVDRFNVAQRLANSKKVLNILIQLNPDSETSKAGISLKEAPQLCAEISDLDGVHLRGFMMIPAPRDSFDEQRRVFASARERLTSCNQKLGLSMDTLSMGMSADLEAAILEGSTMVRIGTDLFGART